MLTTREYALLIGVSQRTVQRWILEGSLLAEKVGNSYRILENEPEPSSAPVEVVENVEPVSTSSDFYTTKQLAAILGVSQRTVQRRIQQGQIEAKKVGRSYQIPKDEENPPTPYVPEEFDEGEEPDFPITDETKFAQADLRQEFATLEETQDYATPIPVPFLIIKNPSGLFRVVIQYDTVLENDNQPEEEFEEE